MICVCVCCALPLLPLLTCERWGAVCGGLWQPPGPKRWASCLCPRPPDHYMLQTGKWGAVDGEITRQEGKQEGEEEKRSRNHDEKRKRWIPYQRFKNTNHTKDKWWINIGTAGERHRCQLVKSWLCSIHHRHSTSEHSERIDKIRKHTIHISFFFASTADLKDSQPSRIPSDRDTSALFASRFPLITLSCRPPRTGKPTIPL